MTGNGSKTVVKGEDTKPGTKETGPETALRPPQEELGKRALPTDEKSGVQGVVRKETLLELLNDANKPWAASGWSVQQFEEHITKMEIASWNAAPKTLVMKKAEQVGEETRTIETELKLITMEEGRSERTLWYRSDDGSIEVGFACEVEVLARLVESVGIDYIYVVGYAGGKLVSEFSFRYGIYGPSDSDISTGFRIGKLHIVELCEGGDFVLGIPLGNAKELKEKLQTAADGADEIIRTYAESKAVRAAVVPLFSTVFDALSKVKAE